MRDRFAHWLCAQPWVWGCTEGRGGRFATHIDILCRARAMGVAVGWRHLTGRVDINAACADVVPTAGVSQDA